MTRARRFRILFVDDDARLLDGLRRALHSHRSRWELLFALGGAEALATLMHAPADVVISDMRMPGMDGAALLGEIARLQPQTIRVVLSGQTHAEAAHRAAHAAHRFIAKPMDAASLTAMIERLPQLRDDPFVAALLGNIGCLWTQSDAQRPIAGAYVLGLWGLPEEIVAAVAQRGRLGKDGILSVVSRVANDMARACIRGGDVSTCELSTCELSTCESSAPAPFVGIDAGVSASWREIAEFEWSALGRKIG